MVAVLRMILYAMFAVSVGCGSGGSSGNDNRDPDPTSTPAATATPQPTPEDRASAWSVGDRSEPGGPDTPGRVEGIILRSTDAGAHWTQTLSVEGAGFEGVSFADASRGWVVGFSGGAGEILRSDDSGLTWASQRAAVPLDGIFSLHAVQALSRDTVVAVGGGVPLQGTGDAPGLLLRTENAGATWTVVPIPTGGGGDSTRTRLVSVCITPGGTGLAVGSGTSTRLVVRTSDHGMSWTDITTRVVGSTAGELLDVACHEDEFWVATTGNTLAGTFVRYSADRGATWRDALPVELNTGIVGISAPGRGVAVAVGGDAMNQPLILRTEDAGVTWTRQPIEGIATEWSLNAVSFAGPNDGTAVGAPSGLPPGETGSLTALSPTEGSSTWTRGESLEGFVSLYDVARIP